MVIPLVAALLLGIALTAVGLRGRRTDDHPLCRRCRFDLTGRPSTAERRCPECGADLARPRAVAVGHRRRRPVVLTIGVGLLAPALLVAALVGYDVVAGVDWRRHAPVALLLREAAAADPARHRPAVAELAARLADGRLSSTGRDRVADAALAAQADAGRPWDPAWGDWLERARAAGRLSDDRWHRYAAGSWPGAYQLRVRPRVRDGDPIPYRVDGLPARVGNKAGLYLVQTGEQITWPGGPTPEPNDNASEGSLSSNGGGSSGSSVRPDEYAGHLPVGHHTLHLRAAIRILSGPGAVPPLATGTLDLSAPFDLLPADRPTVAVVHDPALADPVRRSVSAELRNWSTGTTSPHVTVDDAPVGLSFELFIRPVGGPEWSAGTFALPAAAPGRRSTSRFGLGGSRGRRLPTGSTADVVLRPSPAAAVDTIDATEAWDGELVLHGVPVR